MHNTSVSCEMLNVRRQILCSKKRPHGTFSTCHLFLFSLEWNESHPSSLERSFALRPFNIMSGNKYSKSPTPMQNCFELLFFFPNFFFSSHLVLVQLFLHFVSHQFPGCCRGHLPEVQITLHLMIKPIMQSFLYLHFPSNKKSMNYCPHFPF